ncbi:HAF repeat-containing protein [Rhizobacter sp. Root1221]|uniref:HAF repeat-containing protein n=1 Tax=Rhizobacter sp. Root1221 TaxID=1736433 RepID=UPI000700DD30|nr:HAF repeat-containing protein [Rhizobacter sp. Root1221]KQW00644.1 hypothetical protein ASC87_17450 [Rhizobacter sp. Root1221]
MPLRPSLVASAWATVLAVVCTPSQALPRYELFDLGALTGQGAFALRINDAGQVLGHGGGYGTFLYTPGSGLADVSVLAGRQADSSFTGYGLNNLGQVVGWSGQDDRSFIYRPGQPLEYLPAGYSAYTVNNAGQYVGYRPGDDSGFYRHTPGVGYERMPVSVLVTDLLNDRGQVAGLSEDLSTMQAVRSDGQSVQSLGDLGGDYSWAHGINNAGDVVGNARTADGLSHAFLYTDASGMVDLDTRGLGHPAFSNATAINDHGLIGGEFTDGASRFRAFVSDGTSGLVDLNSLIDPALAEHWVITGVDDINNRGQIIGSGLFDGRQRSFILSMVAAPVPEPQVWLMLLMGLPLLRRVVRQRALVHDSGAKVDAVAT